MYCTQIGYLIQYMSRIELEQERKQEVLLSWITQEITLQDQTLDQRYITRH